MQQMLILFFSRLFFFFGIPCVFLGVVFAPRPCHVPQYRNMAAVVYDQGKLDESVAIQERALALMVQTHEPAHTDVGLYKLYLGELVEEQKDYPRALKLLLEALECLNNLTQKLAEKGEKPKKRISTRTKDGNEAVERIYAAM